MDKIVLIEVYGGVVQEVTCDPELFYFIMDYDNLESVVECPICSGELDAVSFCHVCKIAWGEKHFDTFEVLRAVRQYASSQKYI